VENAAANEDACECGSHCLGIGKERNHDERFD
jgi:hypothetical protein